MRVRVWLGVAMISGAGLLVAVNPGCGGSGSGSASGVDGGSSGDSAAPVDGATPMVGSLSIDPQKPTLDLATGKAPPTQAFTVTLHMTSGDQDVSKQSTFVVSDPSIGAMTENVFVASGSRGGTAQITATYGAQSSALTASTTITVRATSSVPAPDCMGACATFPADGAPPCTQIAVAPAIVYPTGGMLLPPNMGTFAVQWTPFPGGPPALPVQEFEIDFENAVTDVRVVTKCTAELMDTDTPPVGTGACAYTLDATTFDLIGASNRGGDPVKVTVRATSDGTCATPSTNSANVSFAQEDMKGAIFYARQEDLSSGVSNVYAKVWGTISAETQLTGLASSNLTSPECYGCHAPSRDGTRMTLSFTDSSFDDEFVDNTHTLMDVASRNSIDGKFTYGAFEPGFQVIAPDNSVYLATNGNASGPTNAFFMFEAAMGAPLNPPTATIGPAMIGALPARPTMPSWAPDGKSIVFVEPTRVGSWNNNNQNDDNHIFGGSLYTATYDSAAHTFGTAAPIITSAGENNYYPHFSPDGAFLVFDRVPTQTVSNPIAGNADCHGTGLQVTCPNDSFFNPKARLFFASAKGASPVDAEKANGSPAANSVDVSNSVPSFSPFVQTYKGHQIVWVTFTSTRDYGLRVRNHKAGMYPCYPPNSLELPGYANNTALTDLCQAPQIWMAAIDLTILATGKDPSFNAFWMPFQKEGTHNRMPQWAEAAAGVP